MGMNIQKSAGVKADTFILKRNNMDRRIRMDVAMLIILAICTRLVAGIMNVEKMDAYTGCALCFSLIYVEIRNKARRISLRNPNSIFDSAGAVPARPRVRGYKNSNLRRAPIVSDGMYEAR